MKNSLFPLTGIEPRGLGRSARILSTSLVARKMFETFSEDDWIEVSSS
jgi:hypothetical protein